jgi:peptide/nickel transport system substrate-binding protein
MKKWVLALAVVTVAGAVSSAAMAAPFVFPAKWSVSNPSEVKAGGTVRRGQFGGEPRTFNPYTSTSAGSILDFVTGGSFFLLDSASLEYVPHVAESYTISNDKLIWTFKIRPEAKWSDGKPMVADDWVTTYKIQTDEDVGYPNYEDWFLNDKPIVVSKIDNATVRITFPSAAVTNIEQAGFTAWPAHVFGPVYASKGAAGIKAMWSINEPAENIVTGGAWKFTGYRQAERMSFVKNPFYGEWNKDSAGKALPYMDGQVINLYKDQNAQFAAYLAGQIDAIGPRNADDLAQIKRAIDAGNLKAVLRPNASTVSSTGFIVFNWNRKSDPVKQRLFRDTNFRRAMSHLLNRKAMIDNVYGGLATPLWTSVPTVFKDWVSPTLKKYDFDPEAATKLLSGLGYNKKNAEGFLVNREGKVLEFDFVTNTGNSTGDAMSRIWVEEAKKVGVKINYQPIAFNTIVGNLTSRGDDRKWDAILIYFGAGGVVFPFTETIEKCDAAFHMFNTSGKCLFPWETQVQALIERGKAEFDTAKRKAIAYQIQDIWTANQPLIYVPATNIHFTYLARLKGEYPAAIASGYVGVRSWTLSWIQE